MRFLVLPLLLAFGCASAQVETRNVDRFVRSERAKLSSAYRVASVESTSDPSIVSVRVLRTDMCRTTKIFDRTVVTERTLSNKATTGTWWTSGVGVLSVGALIIGSVMVAGGESAFIDHRERSTDKTTELEFRTPGHLLLWGSLGSLLLIPAAHNLLEAQDDERHVGYVRVPQMPAVCGQRPASGVRVAMAHIGQAKLDIEGTALFDLRGHASALLEHGPQLSLVIGSKEIGNTGLGLRPFYDELMQAKQAQQAEERRERLAVQAEERRSRIAQETAQHEREAEERRVAQEQRDAALAAQQVALEADQRQRADEEATRVAAEKQATADRVAAEKKKKAAAMKRLQEMSQ